MPPAIANQIHGDTAFLAADDPVKNGYGSVSVASNIELTAAAATPQYLRTAASDLNVSAAKGVSVTASAGPLALSSTSQAVTVGGTSATTSTTGKQVISAGGAIEAQAAASSFLRTSAGDLDVRASAGNMTVVSSGPNTVSSLDNSLYLSSTTVGQKVRVDADRFEVAAAANGANITATGEMRLASSAGNSYMTAMSGVATVLARDDVTVASNTGDTTVAAYDATKSVKVLGTSVLVGDGATSTTTVAGNLVVNGSTTSVNTVNTTVADNLMSLNTAPVAAGRSPGLIFERHATDHGGVVGDTRTAFVYDEGADDFKLGYTDSDATSSSVVFSRLANFQAHKVTAAQFDVQVLGNPIVSPDINWTSFQLAENSQVQTSVELPVLAKKWGAYDLVVESADGNSCGVWRIAKSSSASSSFVSMSSVQAGNGGELLGFRWAANTYPAFYHAVPRTGGTAALITYRVRYITSIAI